MAKQVMVTAEGLKQLEEELDYLKGEKRKEIAEKIKVARSYGDLSENSEYDEAKAEQGKIHSRIAELREMISNAKVIDESQIDESVVSVGSIVKVFNVERNKEFTYHIVGSYETDPQNGKISDASPIGAKLLGSRAGDEVVIDGVKVQHIKVLDVTRAREH